MEPRIPKPAPPLAKPGAQPQKQFALRFISGKYQGGEFPLPADREIVVGRSSELDMVLVEDMVSRRHAKISVERGEIHIQDLGSTNGTFVNGEKVQKAKLNEGDRILIGTSIIKLVVATPGAAQVPSGADQSGVKEANTKLEEVANARKTSQVKTMTGAIEEVPLPDLLQLFGTSKKNGVLVIRTDNQVGKIYLEKGNIVFGAVNDNFDAPAMKSMIRILSWEKGTFELEPPEEGRTFADPLDISTEGLLMEAMRQIDELKRVAEKLPPMNASLSVASPLIPPLRDLKPEELDVLQLAINYPQVEAVMNKSLAADHETGETLAKLISLGYLRKE